MFVFRKIWRAFSWITRFEIRPFVFLIEPGHGKNLHPSTVCIEYDHELEKAALMQYNNYGMEGPDINIFSKT